MSALKGQDQSTSNNDDKLTSSKSVTPAENEITRNKDLGPAEGDLYEDETPVRQDWEGMNPDDDSGIRGKNQKPTIATDNGGTTQK